MIMWKGKRSTSSEGLAKYASQFLKRSPQMLLIKCNYKFKEADKG